ncbi:MAG TPA: ethylbenzene dehydrogenase-related protein [Blastocatellia bacterium]|nr:ethylbenzene dehydrogenase-related protein [Blastocatellia bacterium]HMV87347.1 ethylbenzene dehydrogenase-related protein [Blastocatellia bacterium]HMX25693.1 ethylbenzene dehydrogenase-related protein [Blastocatellia bacterium]HMY75776.1 ethylbenzene dehydrogenase-related protein [Blastocatellia bacterium]HMZ20627.1 ethylbenzene dehydrogenase-related protein [Blastocatellia bacterium]
MNNTFRFFLALALFSLTVSGCSSAVATTSEVVAVQAKAVPAAPNDAAWNEAPEHQAKLLLQDLVEPRLMKASTGEVRVRAITNGSEVAFRLQWDDKTQNDLPGPARFLDACAVQVPAKLEANVPDPQMGGQGKMVEITYWRADWQAAVNGRPDSLKEMYPNAGINGYPFEANSLEKGSAAQQEMATRYAPARALGNRRVGPRETPVEDLIADGPGTLSPAPASSGGGGSKGKGVKSENGWSVVITRKMPNGLAPGARTQVAFAVWEGGHNETGARKMRTGWVPLLMKGAETK